MNPATSLCPPFGPDHGQGAGSSEECRSGRATFAPVRAGGDYELLERIGVGGMAEVFLARQAGPLGFEKKVVIKKLFPDLAGQRHFARMFIEEAKLAARITHRNVVQVYGFGETEAGELFIAMEHVPGSDLRVLLREASRREVRLPLWFSVHVAIEVLSALGYAHEMAGDDGHPLGLVHRDVTPANIFISTNGDVKLGDFGIAKSRTSRSVTRVGQVKGKLPYMAPEQLLREQTDRRTDLFALAVVLWECITQRRLFGARSEMQVMKDICGGTREPPSRYTEGVPPELDEIVLRALAPEPASRFATAAELQRRLIEVLWTLRRDLISADVGRFLSDTLSGTAEPWVPSPRTRDVEKEGDIGEDSLTPTALARPPRQAPTISSPPSYEALVAPSLAASPPDLVAYDTSGSETGRPPGEIPIVIGAAIDGAAAAPPPSRAVVQPGRYVGPAPFYLRDETCTTWGPWSFAQLNEHLRPEVLRASSKHWISGDGVRWMTLEELEMLRAQDRPSGIVEVERAAGRWLERPSLLGVLWALKVRGATGRLLVERKVAPRGVTEIHLVDGDPTYVSSAHGEDIAERLVRMGLLTKDEVPLVVHEVLTTRRNVELVAGDYARGDVLDEWPRLMRDRLVALFACEPRRFAFDPDSAPWRRTPFASSTFALLVEVLGRAKSEDEVRAGLAGWMQTSFRRIFRLESFTAGGHLSEAQKSTIDQLSHGRPLGDVLSDHAGDPRGVLVVAKILIEGGLLVPRGVPGSPEGRPRP